MWRSTRFLRKPWRMLLTLGAALACLCLACRRDHPIEREQEYVVYEYLPVIELEELLEDSPHSLQSDSQGMIQICVTNMPVPELIQVLDRACVKSNNGYSLKLRLLRNWVGQTQVLEDSTDDPFASNSKWTYVDKTPRVTVTENRIFITNLLHNIQDQAVYMGVSYLNDGRDVLITALPFRE